MTVHTLDSDNFQSFIRDHPIVILDFWATWCGPCRGFAPIYESAANRHTDVAFGKIDTDAEADLAQSFAIRSVPTLMIIREGILVMRESGATTTGGLEDMIRFARELDMDEIRAEIEAVPQSGEEP